MHTSQSWINQSKKNLQFERIDWNLSPSILKDERKNTVKAMQARQLGETSDGSHLLKASRKYASKINDPLYTEAVKLFIKEEQKHGNNLGKYLDRIGEKRISSNWADTLFRRIRYYNSSMELWTLAVITVESTAQIFYQSLKDATSCNLLKQICSDILIDEAFHINFQVERFCIIYETKTLVSR